MASPAPKDSRTPSDFTEFAMRGSSNRCIVAGCHSKKSDLIGPDRRRMEEKDCPYLMTRLEDLITKSDGKESTAFLCLVLELVVPLKELKIMGDDFYCIYQFVGLMGAAKDYLICTRHFHPCMWNRLFKFPFLGIGKSANEIFEIASFYGVDDMLPDLRSIYLDQVNDNKPCMNFLTMDGPEDLPLSSPAYPYHRRSEEEVTDLFEDLRDDKLAEEFGQRKDMRPRMPLTYCRHLIWQTKIAAFRAASVPAQIAVVGTDAHVKVEEIEEEQIQEIGQPMEEEDEFIDVGGPADYWVMGEGRAVKVEEPSEDDVVMKEVEVKVEVE